MKGKLLETVKTIVSELPGDIWGAHPSCTQGIIKWREGLFVFFLVPQGGCLCLGPV